jgi:hypothetical protein
VRRILSVNYLGSSSSESTAGPVAELDGPRAEAMRRENALALFGDWSVWYPNLEVLQRFEVGEKDIVVLRTGDTSAPETTLYVDWHTGRLVHTDRVSFVEGMGRLGQQTAFEDFRDVSGMLLPFKTSVRLANAMIGTIETTVEDVELGVALAAGFFQLTD